MSLKSTVVLMLVFASAGCSAGQRTGGALVRRECPAFDDDGYFFAKGEPAFGVDSSDVDSSERRLYSSRMRLTRLRSLSCGESEDAYRLIIFRPVGPLMHVVDISKSRSWNASVVTIHGIDGALQAGEQRTSRNITGEDVRNIVMALDAASFWSIPPLAGSPANDGATWIIEVRVDGRYRAVRRLSPYLETDRQFREAGLEFFRVAGVKAPGY